MKDDKVLKILNSFNSDLTFEDIKILKASVLMSIKEDGKKISKSSQKRIKRNKEFLQAYNILLNFNIYEQNYKRILR